MMGVFVQVNEDSPRAATDPIGYVVEESGCWQWVGGATARGYGVWWNGNKQGLAHRQMYERVKGPIPDGKQLDHLCRNHGCVNPDHLEPVTSRENTLRGRSQAAERAALTTCVRGHPFTEANTYFRKDGKGRRQCRTCKGIRDRAAWALNADNINEARRQARRERSAR